MGAVKKVVSGHGNDDGPFGVSDGFRQKLKQRRNAHDAGDGDSRLRPPDHAQHRHRDEGAPKSDEAAHEASDQHCRDDRKQSKVERRAEQIFHG